MSRLLRSPWMFYVSALAVLTGAEMNAEIEHASPYGKAPGEKVPGEKRRLGRAAQRHWEERIKTDPPTPKALPAELPPAPPQRRSAAAYLVLGIALIGTFASGRHRAR